MTRTCQPSVGEGLGVPLLPLDDVVAQADYLSIHCFLWAGNAPPDQRGAHRPDEAGGVADQHGPWPHRGRGSD